MYNKNVHIHFVGIGGIGMSAIATILAKQGYIISGCDAHIAQKNVQNLIKLGCIIYEGNNTPSCKDNHIDILVYSSAIKPDNPELIAARARAIPTIPRALMLAELMRTKYSIAIAGSHGKTTTTSLISHILLTAHYDPTIIIGGHLNSISHNAHYGMGNFLVAEADESDRSLTHLHPTLALITNIDLEHLETYSSLQDIKQTFLQFLRNIPFYGKAFLCIDDPEIQSLLPLPDMRIATYGFNTTAETSACDIIVHAEYTTFTLVKHKTPLTQIYIPIPGKHNAQNALGAIAIAQELNVPLKHIVGALATFPGVERRFSYHGLYKDAEVFDDYGHHPQEIEQTLLIARKRTKNNLIVVFQPHRYIRTKYLWQDFIALFLRHSIQHLIITDIYAASETPIEGITSERFVSELQLLQPSNTISYIPYEHSHIKIKTAIDTNLHKGDLILLLGAGSIYTVAKTLCNS